MRRFVQKGMIQILGNGSPSSGGGGGNSGGGGSDWIGDGNTHIWVSLREDWKSPILGVYPNGTVTVDWGDGSTPDVLTGTSLSTLQCTPVHNYEKAGDYVITLTVDGEMTFSGTNYSYNYSALLRYANKADSRNHIYWNSVLKVEIGNGVPYIGAHAFHACNGLKEITIPEGVESIGDYALTACDFLRKITIPESVKSIGANALLNCTLLEEITIPSTVESIGIYAFRGCKRLKQGILLNISSVGDGIYAECENMRELVISEGVEVIPSNLASNVRLLGTVGFPESVKTIGSYAFNASINLRILDFTKHTFIPALSATNAFNNISYDFEIRVPTALAEEWKAATNWSTYASKIVGV